MRISDLGFSYMRMMAIQRAAMKSIKSVNIDVKLKQKHDKDMKTTMFKWTMIRLKVFTLHTQDLSYFSVLMHFLLMKWRDRLPYKHQIICRSLTEKYNLLHRISIFKKSVPCFGVSFSRLRRSVSVTTMTIHARKVQVSG